MTTDAVGGVFVYTIELTRELLARGCSVVLAVVGPRLSAVRRAELEAVACERLQVYERTCALEWMDEPWADVEQTGAWLLRLARHMRPDCIHLNDYAHGSLAWPAPVLIVGHSCVLSWWRAVYGQAAPERYAHYHQVVRAGLAGADCVVAPSANMLRSLDDLYGPLTHTRVIANGIARQTQTLDTKEPVILCAGRLWDRAKNLSVLQQCAANLSWPVHIAGATCAPGTAAHAATARELSACRTLGELSRAQLLHHLDRAAVYVAPARYEPFGLSILEAAAAGCALVLGRISSLRELWSDAALFVDPDDPEALSGTLRTLMADDARRAWLAHTAWLRARAYTAAAMGNAYYSLYVALIRGVERDREVRCDEERISCGW